MRTIDQMVQQEVLCCMSSLVSTLASGYGMLDGEQHQKMELGPLVEQAFELALPISDYEEAAIQAGFEQRELDGTLHWCHRDTPASNPYENFYETARDVCEQAPADPYDREVYEHWAVSSWFAEKLIAQGEKVDTDFAGLIVWARTTSGQGIASDSVIQRIYSDMMKAD